MSNLQIIPLSHSELAVAQALLKRSCQYDDVAVVAEEKLYFEGALSIKAEPLAVYDGSSMVGVACTSGRWLRLLAVEPHARKQGIGSHLLHACELQISKHSHDMELMAQPGNYLSPGIDSRNTETILWLQKRDYHIAKSMVENLRIDLQENPKLCADRQRAMLARVENAGYQVQRLASPMHRVAAAWVERHFSAGWAFEVEKSASSTYRGVFVAIEKKSQDIVGFAAHDGNNSGLGWFGPTGTALQHRGAGIGGALYMACLSDLKRAGHHVAEVAWIGPRAFYESLSGVSSTRYFRRMNKTYRLKGIDE